MNRDRYNCEKPQKHTQNTAVIKLSIILANFKTQFVITSFADFPLKERKLTKK